MAGDWPKIDYCDTVLEKTGIDVLKASEEEMAAKLAELQQKLIDRGDTEAMMADWEFVEMLEHGMPPTCGFGFGERLFAFLVDKPIREVTLFPLMKPKMPEGGETATVSV